jgi:hypothetical protein
MKFVGHATGMLPLSMQLPVSYYDELNGGSTRLVGGNDAPYEIQAGEELGVHGMTFDFEAETPQDFVTAQSYGQDKVAQLVKVDSEEDYSIAAPWTHTAPPPGDQYAFGLDNSYPYEGPFTLVVVQTRPMIIQILG